MAIRKSSMSAEEFRKMIASKFCEQPKQPVRRKPRDLEHQLQVRCVEWFFKESPYSELPLFAVPNGGRRDAVTGAKMKAEGVVAGVADLILLHPSKSLEYHSLCIEMKIPKGGQSQSQKEWQRKAEASGNKYVVCRGLEQFQTIIRNYLHND